MVIPNPGEPGPRAVRDKGVTQNYLVEAKAEKAPLPASVPQNPPFPDWTAQPLTDSQQRAVTSGLVQRVGGRKSCASESSLAPSVGAGVYGVSPMTNSMAADPPAAAVPSPEDRSVQLGEGEGTTPACAGEDHTAGTLSPVRARTAGIHLGVKGTPGPGETVQLLDRGCAGIQPTDTTLAGGVVGVDGGMALEKRLKKYWVPCVTGLGLGADLWGSGGGESCSRAGLPDSNGDGRVPGGQKLGPKHVSRLQTALGLVFPDTKTFVRVFSPKVSPAARILAAPSFGPFPVVKDIPVQYKLSSDVQRTQ
ncbi:hypothetical protein MJT46_001759 [Ovis ammon polii x Ovis aries]|nr:hypothetical protein MJT46_001759 [Ovis ammon polii x Ovis aries]